MSELNLDFLDREYFIKHNCQIFTYLLLIIKSRYTVYDNVNVNGLIDKYAGESGISFPSEVLKWNDMTMANDFLKKVILDCKYNSQKINEVANPFSLVNELLDEQIENVLNLYPRNKLLVNLLMFSDYLSKISQNKDVNCKGELKNDLEKILSIIQEIDRGNEDESRGLLGGLKNSFNYLIIKLIMMPDNKDEQSCEKYFDNYFVNYYLLFGYGIAKVLLLSFSHSRHYIQRRTKKETIPFPKSLILSDMVPQDIQSEFDKYVKCIKKETLGLNSSMSSTIFPKFKSEYGFDPLLIRDSFRFDSRNYRVDEDKIKYLSEEQIFQSFNLKQSLGVQEIKNELFFIENDLFGISEDVFTIIADIENNKNDLEKIILKNNDIGQLKSDIMNHLSLSGYIKEMFSNYLDKYYREKQTYLGCFEEKEINKFPRLITENLVLGGFSIFHQPIFKLSSGYLISESLINEGLYHLASGILSRKNKGGDKISKEIVSFFDEQYIPDLESFLKDVTDFYRVNLDLMRLEYGQIKELLYNEKGIKKELDVLFVKDEILYIFDLKNYGIQHSLYECQKLLNRVSKECSKLRKTRDFILDNKNIVQLELGISFKEVKLGILTANTSIFDCTPDFFEDVTIKSIRRFFLISDII